MEDRVGSFTSAVQWIDRDHNDGVSRPLTEADGRFYTIDIGDVSGEMLFHEDAVGLIGGDDTAALVDAGRALFWEPTDADGPTLADRWPALFDERARVDPTAGR